MYTFERILNTANDFDVPNEIQIFVDVMYDY